MKKIILSFFNKGIPVTTLQTYFLCFFFIFYLYFGLHDVYRRISWCDGTLLADWLINYQDGGYKRRGLSGAITIPLSKWTGIYIGKLVFGIISFLYLIFSWLFIIYFRKIKLNFSLILVFLLPTTLLFPINDFYAFARKEFLFYILLVFFLISKRKFDIYSWKYVIILSSIIVFITHLHESIVFYISYILILYFIDYFFLKKGNLFKIFVIGCSAFIPAFCIFIFGVNVNMGGSWEIFKSLGVNKNIMDGILAYPIEGFGSDKTNSISFAIQKRYEFHIISYIITVLVFYYFIIKNKVLSSYLKKIIVIHLILLLISLPLFYLTIDWGRWLNIHFVSSFLILVSYLPVLDNTKTNIKKYANIVFDIKNSIKVIILLTITFGFTMRHVEDGFILGLNNTFYSLIDLFSLNFISQLRDLIWVLRN
jgi:hypothetical protein